MREAFEETGVTRGIENSGEHTLRGRQSGRRAGRFVLVLASVWLALAVLCAFPLANSAFAASGASYFDDVSSDAWYVTEYDYIGYVYEHGYMTGYSGISLFGPEDTVTRADVATVLYRIAHDDDSATTDEESFATSTVFSDVPTGCYFTAAIDWCCEMGYVTGDTDADGNLLGTFRPYDAVTRQELVTMLWRFAGEPLASADLTAWPDSSSIYPYALSAITWAASSGIMTGETLSDGTYCNPLGNATRAQFAKMLTQLLNPSLSWDNIYAPDIE